LKSSSNLNVLLRFPRGACHPPHDSHGAHDEDHLVPELPGGRRAQPEDIADHLPGDGEFVFLLLSEEAAHAVEKLGIRHVCGEGGGRPASRCRLKAASSMALITDFEAPMVTASHTRARMTEGGHWKNVSEGVAAGVPGENCSPASPVLGTGCGGGAQVPMKASSICGIVVGTFWARG
jgi:hypothetical protein